MTVPFSSLSLYRVRDELDGEPVTNFGDFIDPQKLKETRPYELAEGYDFKGRLFVAEPQIGPPAWLEPLKEGFSKLTIPDSVSNNAVLVIQVDRRNRHLHFAATFGFGRFLLRPGAFLRNYGLRVAINAIYSQQKQRGDGERIRSVDSKILAANVVRTRRQADHKADFETFEIDIQRDLLSGLTGTPQDADAWGKRIDGSDAVHLHRPIPLEQLGEICLQVEEESGDVPVEFSWIDKIVPVDDPTIIPELKQRIVTLVRSGAVGNFELAPPELVEWGDLDHFAFSFDSEYEFAEPGLQEYIARLRTKAKLDNLSLNQLTSSHALLAFDAGGNEIGRWPVFRCLTGEIKHKSKTYVLSEGEFFEVAPDYMAQLDAEIDQIPRFAEGLPPSGPGWSEDRYNKLAAKAKKYLLLDKKTVTLPSKTTPIEICDLLSPGKALIHVKRKLGSSSLSHLFSQGVVSADLLLMGQEFRGKAHERIAGLTKGSKQKVFSRFFSADKNITASKFTVVYGMIAPWDHRTLADALPFFSKVNLRRCAQDLKRMGYHIACSQIPTLAAVGKKPAAVPGKKPALAVVGKRRAGPPAELPARRIA